MAYLVACGLVQVCGLPGSMCAGSGMWPTWWRVGWFRCVAYLVACGLVQVCGLPGSMCAGSGMWPTWWRVGWFRMLLKLWDSAMRRFD